MLATAEDPFSAITRPGPHAASSADRPRDACERVRLDSALSLPGHAHPANGERARPLAAHAGRPRAWGTCPPLACDEAALFLFRPHVTSRRQLDVPFAPGCGGGESASGEITATAAGPPLRPPAATG